MVSTMRIAQDQLIAALRLRYDHYSAEAVLGAALARAGIAEAATYDAAQLQALRRALARVGDRLGAVDARLDELLATPVPVAAPAPVVKATMTIALTRAPVDDDAEVLVCGSFPALGEWDVSRALPMARSGDAWVASIAVAPGTELAFKFLERRRDGEVVWEGGDNHTLAAAARVDAVWH